MDKSKLNASEVSTGDWLNHLNDTNLSKKQQISKVQ